MPRRKVTKTVKSKVSKKLFDAMMERKLLSTTCDNCPYKKTCPFYKEGSTCVILKDLAETMSGLELDKLRDDPNKLLEVVGAIVQAKLVESNLMRMQQSMLGVQSSKSLREEEKLLIQWIRLALDLMKSMGIISERKEIDTRTILLGLYKHKIEGLREPDKEEDVKVIKVGGEGGE